MSGRQLQTVCDPGRGDTEERHVLMTDVLGSRVRGSGGLSLSSSSAPVVSLDRRDPFVVFIVEEGLLPWNLWLVRG